MRTLTFCTHLLGGLLYIDAHHVMCPHHPALLTTIFSPCFTGYYYLSSTAHCRGLSLVLSALAGIIPSAQRTGGDYPLCSAHWRGLSLLFSRKGGDYPSIFPVRAGIIPCSSTTDTCALTLPQTSASHRISIGRHTSVTSQKCDVTRYPDFKHPYTKLLLRFQRSIHQSIFI